MDKYMFKIFKYLSSIIGHQGNGSLLLFLKKHVWAVSLDVEYETLASHSEFYVTIALTREGLKNVDKVLSAVFRYVFFLAGTLLLRVFLDIPNFGHSC